MNLWTMDRYQARRREGLCGRNGCPAYSGLKSLCLRHAEEQRARSLAYERNRRKAKPNRVAINLAGVR